jgi:hypothetical protein
LPSLQHKGKGRVRGKGVRTEDRHGRQKTAVTQDVVDDGGGAAGQGAPARQQPEHAPRPGPRPRRPRSLAALVLVVVLLVAGVGLAGLVLTGRTLALPVWAVAEIETRLNRTIAASHLPPGAVLSLGGVSVAIDRDLTPRLLLRDLRLVQSSGASILSLPEVRVTMDGAALMRGQMRPATLRLTGARISVARDAEGRLSLAFGGLSGAPALRSPAEILDALDRMFSTPALAGLRRIEGDALSLSLSDARAGRTWEVGDGRLVIENGAQGLAAELGLTLLTGAAPAQARLMLETSKADSSARLEATVDRVAAGDLAAQAAPLAALGLLDAPISGALSGGLLSDGTVGPMSGHLSIAAGTLRAGGMATPVAFDAADLALSYDPRGQRVTLSGLSVESPVLKVSARGTVDLLDGSGAPARPGALPAALVAQFAVSEAMADFEGVFETPVRFTGGAAGLRIRLDPFRVEIGEIRLSDGEDYMALSGEVGVARDGGWQAALDVALNRIDAQRLITIWPVSVVPNTRRWLAENLDEGTFTDVTASFRGAQGRVPRFALDYDFRGAEVRVIRTLPPVKKGYGRAAIQDNSYTVVIEGGHVTPPQGGDIDVSGTVFRVPDIRINPAPAEVELHTDATLTATLSLLDQEPFRFLSKAGQTTDLGEGRVRLVAELAFPLVQKLVAQDVAYSVTGTIHDFRSDRLVAGRSITAADLAVTVTPAGMAVSGNGRFGSLPVTARWTQDFGAEAKGRSKVTGTAQISADRLADLGVTLPAGWLSGEAAAEFDLKLAKDAPGEIVLTSALTGMRLSVPQLFWSKAAGTAAKLRLAARLGARPEVTALVLTAPGLVAEGRITTKSGGGLDLASFSRLQAGSWFDAPVQVKGLGKGRIGVAITGGTIDLRALPKSSSGASTAAGGAVEVQLDRLIVSSGIALTGLSGSFRPSGGGLDGRFVAAVNGAGRVSGTTVPWQGGTAVRLTSTDAGRVLAAAGVFTKARGGTLDLTLQPAGAGRYAGVATLKSFSVQDAPALAAMLSAASVIGLLEQLNGQGILFQDGDVAFEIRPEGVEITRGAAIGASMGISFSGLYRAKSGTMDIQGTISPIYLLNGLGRLFSLRGGEGLFGFTYRLTGPASAMRVSVNPLSILTPGMFREIFRRPAPRLEGDG